MCVNYAGFALVVDPFHWRFGPDHREDRSVECFRFLNIVRSHHYVTEHVLSPFSLLVLFLRCANHGVHRR